MRLRRYLIIFFLLICVKTIMAQPDAMELRKLIASSILPVELDRFYQLQDYNLVWTGYGQGHRCDSLYSLIRSAGMLGLDESDYDLPYLRSVCQKLFPLRNSNDTLNVEIRLTQLALKFIRDLAQGNKPPVFGYQGLNDTLSLNTAELLARSIRNNSLTKVAEDSTISLPVIKIVIRRLALLQQRMDDPDYREEIITSALVSAANKPLLKKLYYLGIIDSFNMNFTPKVITEYIKEGQRQFDLLHDGVLRSTTLSAFNTPLTTRITQLSLAINYFRWLNCISQVRPVIVVNIPAAYLQVYDKGNVTMEMKMIVGKPSTPTPLLTSIVTEAILYPYWSVPRSIAIKELLPAMKRDPGFVEANSFQLIGSNGKIADPYKIEWTKMNAFNFPYTIRQSTGCDNALGLIKLNFYSPYGVYLHDTPNKSLFALNRRYFSHGCMRMEKPMELGHRVLKNNAIAIDTLEEKGCLLRQAPVVVPADEKMGVVVWYNPVGIDTTGRPVYYEDVYKKFTRKAVINPRS